MACRQAIIWTNADLIYWRIYAALGGDELTMQNKQILVFHERGFQLPASSQFEKVLENTNVSYMLLKKR